MQCSHPLLPPQMRHSIVRPSSTVIGSPLISLALPGKMSNLSPIESGLPRDLSPVPPSDPLADPVASPTSPTVSRRRRKRDAPDNHFDVDMSEAVEAAEDVDGDADIADDDDDDAFAAAAVMAGGGGGAAGASGALGAAGGAVAGAPFYPWVGSGDFGA